jgi:HAD superfamily hydrolase (TIGR01509 family)
MSRPAALIFDMDGLLLDTEGTYKRAWTQAALEHGFDLTDELYLKLIGISIADCEVVLCGAFGPTFKVDVFRVRAAELYEIEHKRSGLPLKPGVVELLKWAKADGVPCAVGTSTKTEEARSRLEHHNILDHFQVVIGADLVEKGKPHPDIFLKAQQTLGIAPENCMVLEDAHNGLLAARAGGMRSCLVPDLLPPSAESRHLAEGVFTSLHEVLTWLADDCRTQKPHAEVKH